MNDIQSFTSSVYQDIFFASYQGLALEVDGVLVDVNPKLCELLGIGDRNSIIGQPFVSLIVGADKESYGFNCDKLFNSEPGYFKSKIRLQTESVNEFWVDIACQQTAVNGTNAKYIQVEPINKEISKAELIDRFSALMASVTEDAMLNSMVLNITRLLGVRFAYIGIFDRVKESIDIQAISVDNELVENFSYDVACTPCSNVLQEGIVVHSSNVQEQYPDDDYLVDMQIDSYVGVALKDLKGEALGHVVIMDSKPLENVNLIVTILQLYSDRLAGQLENCEQRRLLIESNSELQKVNQELDHFIYRASHDLRSPLASILGLVNLLRTEKKGEASMEYIEHIDQQIRKLDNFIKDMIDYSRVGRLQDIYEEISFEEMVQEIFKSLEFHENSAQIEKIVELNTTGPFISDKKKLDVILRNLISNAIKYADVRKEKPYIRCTIENYGKACKIVIEDNGIGVTKDRIPDIFKMFYRGTEASQGSGLGLFIVQEALVKLNGEIKVESEVSRWTRFTITLPA